VCISTLKKTFWCRFHYFYTKMPCAARSRRHCRTKGNIAEQNLQTFYNLRTTLLILRMSK